LKNSYFELQRSGRKLKKIAILHCCPKKSPTRGDKRIMPGVQQLLDHLCQLDNVLWPFKPQLEPSGRIKLPISDWKSLFSFRSFCRRFARRDELLPFAVQRFEARTVNACSRMK
jgi:hypothetical protein